jgi:hypothetical protein
MHQPGLLHIGLAPMFSFTPISPPKTIKLRR